MECVTGPGFFLAQVVMFGTNCVRSAESEGSKKSTQYFGVNGSDPT